MGVPDKNEKCWLAALADLTVPLHMRLTCHSPVQEAMQRFLLR